MGTTITDSGVPVATQEQLRIIDVGPLYDGAAAGQDADAAVAAVAAAMRAACLDTGFFYVTGSCLPSTAAIFACMQQLFGLPLEAKAQLDASLSPLHRGYTGLGGAHNCVPDESRAVGPDNKESYLLGAEGGSSVMHGPNVWPDAQLLPGWREAVQRYSADMLQLSRVVARGLALSLALPPAFFTDRMQDPVAQLLLLRYPPPPALSGGGGSADGAQQQQQYVGCGAHTDCGFLTILAQDKVPGLQVRLRSGEWVTAPAIPGAFVVNLGDMMAFWTRGVYKSTQHRVFNSTPAPRYSCPFFCNLDFDAEVDPAALGPAGEAALRQAATGGEGGGEGTGAGAAVEAGQGGVPVKAGHYIMAKLGLMWDEGKQQ